MIYYSQPIFGPSDCTCYQSIAASEATDFSANFFYHPRVIIPSIRSVSPSSSQYSRASSSPLLESYVGFDNQAFFDQEYHHEESPEEQYYNEQDLVVNAKVITSKHLAQIEREVLSCLFVKSLNPVKTAKKPAEISSSSVLIFSKFILDGRFDANADFLELFDLAAAFGFEDLMDMCLTVISHRVHDYDPIELFKTAHFHGSEELKALTFSVIQRTYSDLGDEYVNARNEVDMLLTSTQNIDSYMPNPTECRKQTSGKLLQGVDADLQRLLPKEFVKELLG